MGVTCQAMGKVLNSHSKCRTGFEEVVDRHKQDSTLGSFSAGDSEFQEGVGKARIGNLMAIDVAMANFR